MTPATAKRRYREFLEFTTAIEGVNLPPGIEFLHIAGQTIFPDAVDSDLNSFWLLRRGNPELTPKLFDGGLLQYGLNVLPGGWALMGFKVDMKTPIEVIRLMQANLPTLVAANA